MKPKDVTESIKRNVLLHGGKRSVEGACASMSLPRPRPFTATPPEGMTPKGSKYPNRRYTPQTRIAAPSIKTYTYSTVGYFLRPLGTSLNFSLKRLPGHIIPELVD